MRMEQETKSISVDKALIIRKVTSTELKSI